MEISGSPGEDWPDPLLAVDLGAVTQLLMTDRHGEHPIVDEQSRERHSLAIDEMRELIDEARFEIGVAHWLETQYSAGLSAGALKANVPVRPPEFDSLGLSDDALAMPPSVLALLSGYSDIPSPETLWTEPHRHLNHHRVLSLWFAAQLVDSGIVRVFAALDRMVIMLYFALEPGVRRTLRISRGVEILPAFNAQEIRSLADPLRYGRSQPMDALHGIASSDLASDGKLIRDFFVHRYRLRTQGHGATEIATIDRIVRPIPQDRHVLLGMTLFDEVLRPAVLAAGQVLEAHRAALGFAPVAEG